MSSGDGPTPFPAPGDDDAYPPPKGVLYGAYRSATAARRPVSQPTPPMNWKTAAVDAYVELAKVEERIVKLLEVGDELVKFVVRGHEAERYPDGTNRCVACDWYAPCQFMLAADKWNKVRDS